MLFRQFEISKNQITRDLSSYELRMFQDTHLFEG